MACATSRSRNAAETPDRYSSITCPKVPTDVCIRLAGAAVQNFGAVLVNGFVVQGPYSSPNKELNEDAIAQNCKTDDAVELTFISN